MRQSKYNIILARMHYRSINAMTCVYLELAKVHLDTLDPNKPNY